MSMSGPNPSPNPAFEARRLTSASGWYVRVAWVNGRRFHIPGFASKQEAQRWIEEKAPTWLSAHSRAPELRFAVSPAGAVPEASTNR
jgi:hypothetical protein